MKVRQPFDTDDDSQPVMVPRSDKALVAVSPERVRRLREHMIKTLRELRTAKHLEHVASPMRPEPTGFAARVARTACSLCKGWCCRNGDDDAFLDDRTLARVRLARPDMTEAAMLRLYLERVPPVAYRGVVHLPRETRLHVGPVDACRCVQQLLLRRPWRFYEGRRRANANKGLRRRGRGAANLARSVAVGPTSIQLRSARSGGFSGQG